MGISYSGRRCEVTLKIELSSMFLIQYKIPIFCVYIYYIQKYTRMLQVCEFELHRASQRKIMKLLFSLRKYSVIKDIVLASNFLKRTVTLEQPPIDAAVHNSLQRHPFQDSIIENYNRSSALFLT